MLAYLDALCAALLNRNSIEILRLLGLPDARKLPRVVREEAMTIARAGHDSLQAPFQALHLYYKLSHLVDESAELMEEPAPKKHRTKGGYQTQMEMPLGTRKVS